MQKLLVGSDQWEATGVTPIPTQSEPRELPAPIYTPHTHTPPRTRQVLRSQHSLKLMIPAWEFTGFPDRAST